MFLNLQKCSYSRNSIRNAAVCRNMYLFLIKLITASLVDQFGLEVGGRNTGVKFESVSQIKPHATVYSYLLIMENLCQRAKLFYET